MRGLIPDRGLSERGFVLVAVLWIVMALSALVTIFSVYLANSSRTLAVADNDLVAEALTSAGLELTAYQLLLAEEKSRPSQGSFRFRLDKAEAIVTFTSEAARVDLNAAPRELLANLFEVMGRDQRAASDIADRIVGWRTPPKPNSADNEEALYLAAGLAYGPRGAAFAHVNELSLVSGMSPELAERVIPFVTLFNGSAEIDVLTAAPEVIAALPGMTTDRLTDFLKQRATLPRDKDAIAAALGPAKAAATLPAAKSYRVVTSLNFDDGRRAASEAVILLSADKKNGDPKPGSDTSGTNASISSNASPLAEKAKEPFRILSWRDDFGTATRPSRRAER